MKRIPLAIFLFMTMQSLSAMEKYIHHQPHACTPSKHTKEAQSFTEDNPGSCCFCGLVTCTCFTGVGTCLSLTHSAPMVTLAAWTCCFGTSLYVLKEIALAYWEDKKDQ